MINYEENPELNITPLVDIMLVLLAILMVAMPALIYEEKIIVPQGTQSKSKPMDRKALTIRITLDRKVYIDKDMFELSALADRLVLLQSQYSTDSQVYLKADEGLRYADVMSVLRSLKLARYNNVALETR
mgnify:FL=1